ncbi:MAG TPA: hypothetical protein VIK91_16185 [Nannocystis sp.]
MSLAEVYAEFLRAEGYRPVIDDAGDLVFRCDGGFYFVTIDDDDPHYFRLVFPNFWGLESEAERHRARIAAAEVTAEFKAVKVYPQHDDMQAAVELFLPVRLDQNAFRLVLDRCLGALKSAVRRFSELMEPRPRLRLVETT